MMKAAINWFEIPVSDINRARKFYEQIFEIEMSEVDLGDGPKMALFPTEDSGTGGALIQFLEWYQPSDSKGPLLYLNANPDLKTVLDRVEKAGGKITIPKRQISPEFGYMAVILDTEGNRIALHSDQ